MKKKLKPYSEMNTRELAEATKEFDDPHYVPQVRKPTEGELARLHRVQRRSAADRFRIALVLEKNLVKAADDYALSHGISFSEVVADALQRLIKKKKTA